MNNKQLDSYSLLIVSKYFESTQDYINIICVCKKFKETTEKLRYNPIPITSLKLFPKIQTQYLYTKSDIKIEGIDSYEKWYEVNYDELFNTQEENTKYHHIICTSSVREYYGDTIPKEVNILGDFCFDSANIRTITIPNQVTSLRKCCFCVCSELTNVVLSSHLTSINYYCFGYCYSIASITLPQSLVSIHNFAFTCCSSLKAIEIPDSVTEVGIGVFQKCQSLQSIKLPSSLVKLNNFTFSECQSLKDITLPTDLTYIGEYCFCGCLSLTTITLPITLKQIGYKGFCGCENLVTLVGVEKLKLGNKCFLDCKNLKIKPTHQSNCFVC
ncbi:hypothetical protein QTN25_009415 [Entamoeba marina]